MVRHKTSESKVVRLLQYPFKHGLVSASLGIFILFMMLGVILSLVSDSSKPGDGFFVVDRAFEKLRVSTTFSQEARYKHKVSIAKERFSELQLFALDDVEGLLGSLDETELALVDIKTEIDGLEGLKGSESDAYNVIDNLINLINRYRDFLLGNGVDTEEIQQELDESIKDINAIEVSVAKKSAPASTTTTTVAATPSATTATVAPTLNEEEPNEISSCEQDHKNLGEEVEYEGLTLDKNECDEYIVKIGAIDYVLVTNNNLDYAVDKKVKLHGTNGTNNSIFVTEFEIDD